jgi:ligand-binding sensor domain-containing protein
MKKYSLLAQIYLLLFSLIFISSCDGQNTTQPEDSQSETKTSLNGPSKIIKNYFITEYPQEFFFVQCGLQDKAGNMWFGTAGNGIYIYNGKSFINFTHKEGLCHDDILCCLEDKTGNIWFGTRNGLIRYKPSTGKAESKDFTNFLISENIISNSTRTKLPYTYRVADNFVWSIMQDKAGKIWFGTNKTVYIHDPQAYPDNNAPLFTRFLDNDYILNKDSMQLKDVLSMIQDKKGDIWFASGFFKGEGIFRYDGKSITNFKPDDISSFRSIIEGKNGNLFFLNEFHGVYSYDGKNFSNFTEKIGLKNDTIVAMKEDKAGNFWFGTHSDNMKNGGDGGVWRYDGNSLKLFTTKDGLSHNCVFCIVEDRGGNIWFGTRNTGLCRYNGKAFTDFSE